MANKPFERRTKKQIQIPSSTLSLVDSKLQADTSTMSLGVGTPNLSMSNASKISASVRAATE